MSENLLASDDRGSGDPIVLIHGLTFSRSTWDPVAELLASRYRAITVDLPGHGESTGSAADLQAVESRLAETLEVLKVDRPVVVGHSAGALTATGYASEYPARGVVNVDQPLLVGPFAGTLQQMAEQLRGPDFPRAFGMFEQFIGVDQLPEPERTRVAGTRTVRQETVLDHWHLPMTTPGDELQARVDAMLDAIRVPYAFLAGEPLPPPVQEHLHAHLAQVVVAVWPGSGHLPHLLEPARFAEFVSDFAESIPD